MVAVPGKRRCSAKLVRLRVLPAGYFECLSKMRFGLCSAGLAHLDEFSSDAVQLCLNPALAVLFEEAESGVHGSNRLSTCPRASCALARLADMSVNRSSEPMARSDRMLACIISTPGVTIVRQSVPNGRFAVRTTLQPKCRGQSPVRAALRRDGLT